MGKQTLLVAVIAVALISASVVAWQAIGSAEEVWERVEKQ